ncbi:MAG: DUF1080 domain-containing protein [Pyrinomonadaceae bacterium]|nr:DUF1080 domain-containing protein [Pyrinomonadaceae bacterium]
MKTRRLITLLSLAMLALMPTITARPQTMPPPIVGRWDLTVSRGGEKYTSWLEVERSGWQALVGRFVGRIGGARPIGRIEWSNGVARFSIPAQWESSSTNLRFEGRLKEDESLVGTITLSNGTVEQYVEQFVGRRVPSLRREMPRAWSRPVKLFNGNDLSGWITAPTARSLPSHWTVRDGLLVNTANEGANLMTVERFQDFKLHVEFRYPKGGDSGVFLRGRYEVQIRDNDNRDWPTEATSGAVYSFLIPNENASTSPGQWQTFDITLVGRRVTVILNGKVVIADQIIPGLSGSAIDSDESSPGPIILQGEETVVEFRNIKISVPR